MRDRSQLARNSRSLCSGEPENTRRAWGNGQQEHPRQSAGTEEAQRCHGHPEST